MDFYIDAIDCNTLDLVIADIDGYTDLGDVSSGGSISTYNDKFWANTIVFMDQLENLPVITRVNYQLSVNKYNNYQWFLNGELISGANDSTYTVTQNGIYSVQVTLSCGCVVTSEDFEVNDVSINELNYDGIINIYPNPITETFTIEGSNLISIKVYDIKSKIVEQININNDERTVIDLKNKPDGIYFVKVITDKGTMTKKIIKK